jgi:hypothetical protein
MSGKSLSGTVKRSAEPKPRQKRRLIAALQKELEKR